MKKYFYTIIIFIFAFIIVGCGSKKEGDINKHNKYNNAYECNKTLATGEEDKLYLYFDNDDKLDSFEVYATIEKPDYVEEEDVKKAEERVCGGQGEFKKEWIEECSYSIEDNKIIAHFYFNNGEWFNDYQTKKQFDNFDDEDSDLQGMTCKEYK